MLVFLHDGDRGTGVLWMGGFELLATMSFLGLVSIPNCEAPSNTRQKKKQKTKPSSNGVNFDTLMTRWRETVRKILFSSGW